MRWQSQVIPMLVASLLRPCALAAAGWLMLRILKVRHPASRHAVWTAVIVGMLILPVLGLVTPHWTIALPARHADPPAPHFVPPSPGGSESSISAPVSAGNPAPSSTRLALEPVIVWCYLSGFLALLAYRSMGLLLVSRLLSRSKSLRFGRLRESSDIAAPVVMGLLQPAVILPRGWREWSAHTRRAVLAHEFAHVRRRDTVVSVVVRFTNCVYWFHPLAWLVSRKIAELSEQACDAAVLARMDDPAAYSRMLLAFADAVSVRRRPAVPGLAMVATKGLQQRIDSIFEFAAAKQRKLSHPGYLAVLVGTPILCLTAAAGLGAPTAPPAPNVTSEAAPSVSAEPAAATEPAPQPVPSYLAGLGNVTAFNTVKIRPRVDGQLVAVYKEGQLVQVGDLVAAIDPQPYEIQLAQARGVVAQDQAEIVNARTQSARLQALAEKHLISPDQADQSMASILQLEAKMKIDQTAVDRAELQVAYTKITSPISGMAGLRLVDPGNTVHAADATGILIITQLQPIAVMFTAPEEYVPQIRALLSGNARPAVEAWNRDNSKRLAAGHLEALDNQIDITTGTARLKAVFDNRDGALFPNQFVNVRLMLNRP